MHCGANFKCCDEFDGEYTEVKTEGDKAVHYAKAVCKYCGHFIKWLPTPENIDRTVKRRQTIKKILALPEVQSAHREFLLSINELRKLSPKQTTYYDDLVKKYI
jgi:hypothetical protein